MAKPTYYEQSDIERAQVRLNALSLAHNPEAPPAEVVKRAKEYLEFIEAD
jgi:hypothetical protein